jgi:arylsulfatase A-like enzyme
MDRTVITHTSDHGDLLGDHGLFGKGVMYEEAVCVPLLLRLPGGPRKMINRRVSHIDFVPTILDLLGKQKSPQCIGKSLAPLIRGEPKLPENVFIEWSPNWRTKIKKGSRLGFRREIKRAVEESTRTVISPDGWKLSLRDKDLNELYNLNDDPLEARNLYEDRQYAPVVARLREDILHWQKATKDKIRLG